jgi:hypothetical protein
VPRGADARNALHFEELMELVVEGFEVVGVGILALGSLVALTATDERASASHW